MSTHVVHLLKTTKAPPFEFAPRVNQVTPCRPRDDKERAILSCSLDRNLRLEREMRSPSDDGTLGGNNIISELMNKNKTSPLSSEERERVFDTRLSKPPRKDEVHVQGWSTGRIRSFGLLGRLHTFDFLLLYRVRSFHGLHSIEFVPPPHCPGRQLLWSNVQPPYQVA
jgi:hypothetical protein